MDCDSWYSWALPNCWAADAVESIGGGIFGDLLSAAYEAYGRLVAAEATLWVYIPTPVLIDGDASSAREAGTYAAAGGFTDVWSAVFWFSLGICVLALIAAGARMAWASSRSVSSSREHLDRIGVILFAVVVVSAAGVLVTGVVPSSLMSGSRPVVYVQSSLYWYMAVLAAISVCVGAVRMVWSGRGEAGRELVKSLLTFGVVSAAGLTLVSGLVAASDALAVWLLEGVTDCSIATDTTDGCFSEKLGKTLILGADGTVIGDLPQLLTILVLSIAIIAGVIQIVLMLARGAMIVVLAGMLPLSASALNTETGKNMFKHVTGWLLAAICYKPAAAVIYAVAMLMYTGSEDDGDSVIQMLTSVITVFLAVFAMPALIRFIVPAASAVSAGAGVGGALGMAALSSMPSGAVSARGRNGSNGGSSDPGGPGGPSGSGGPTSGSSGSGGPTGSKVASGAAKAGAGGALPFVGAALTALNAIKKGFNSFIGAISSQAGDGGSKPSGSDPKSSSGGPDGAKR